MNNVNRIISKFETELAKNISEFKYGGSEQAEDAILAVMFGSEYIKKLINARTHFEDPHIYVEGIKSDAEAEMIHQRIIDIISRHDYPIKEISWHKSGEPKPEQYRWKFHFEYVS